MTIQEQAAEIRSLLMLHGANMKRMRDYIELIQQLHSTPRKYVTAISEVVRRRSYSQAFLMVIEKFARWDQNSLPDSSD